MTNRQSWALFCGTGVDVRGCGLSLAQASDYIDRMKSGQDITQELVDLGGTLKKKVNKTDWGLVFNKAHEAGMEEGEAVVPTPMTVVGGGQEYHVSEGVCGFAWIGSINGNSSFGRWLKKTGKGRKGYPSGMTIWVHQFGQSMARKEAYASAFADVLKEAGVKCFAGSRLD